MASPTAVTPAGASPTARPIVTAPPDPRLVNLESGDRARYAGSVLAGEVEELTITAVIMGDVDMPAFSPTIIWVEPGQRLKLIFHDLDGHDQEGTPAHDFTVEDLDLALRIPRGGDATVELTMPESGTLQFICSPHFATYQMAGEFRVQ